MLSRVHTSTRTRILVMPVVALGLSLAVSACGSSSKTDTSGSATAGGSTTTTAAGAAAATGTTITIKDFAFKPQELAAKVGDTITVKNDDTTTHTLSALKANPAFDTGDLDAGATKTFTVDKAGTFKFQCNIHNYMTGSITVS